MTDLQHMTERLYENSSLRDDLDDDQAAIALKWAENRLPSLAETYPDEAALEEAFGTLERILRGMNRLIKRGGDYSGEQLRARVGKVVEWAQGINLPVDAAAIDAYVIRLSELDNMGRVQALTQALAPDAPPAEASPQDAAKRGPLPEIGGEAPLPAASDDGDEIPSPDDTNDSSHI